MTRSNKCDFSYGLERDPRLNDVRADNRERGLFAGGGGAYFANKQKLAPFTKLGDIVTTYGDYWVACTGGDKPMGVVDSINMDGTANICLSNFDNVRIGKATSDRHLHVDLYKETEGGMPKPFEIEPDGPTLLADFEIEDLRYVKKT